MCTKFGVAFRDLKFAFREYRDSRGKAIVPCVSVLLNCVNTIPVSTAGCERGFSKMNVVCSSLRTRGCCTYVFTNICVPVLFTCPPMGAIKICKIMCCIEQKGCRLYARSQTCCCPSSSKYCHESFVGCYVKLQHQLVALYMCHFHVCCWNLYFLFTFCVVLQKLVCKYVALLT